MLFSNEDVATMINDQFEPVWVSLRPVPRITIDFGNGNIIRRTLHGNIATWVCLSDGSAVDVLPGIYEPETWSRALAHLRDLHDEIVALDSRVQRDQLVNDYRMRAPDSWGRLREHLSQTDLEIPGIIEDTWVNETVRRERIREYTANKGLFPPAEVTDWLYREILNADLQDPWLGLGDSLFANYPFDD